MAPSEDQQRSLEEEVREEKVMRWTSCDGGEGGERGGGGGEPAMSPNAQLTVTTYNMLVGTQSSLPSSARAHQPKDPSQVSALWSKTVLVSISTHAIQ